MNLSYEIQKISTKCINNNKKIIIFLQFDDFERFNNCYWYANTLGLLKLKAVFLKNPRGHKNKNPEIFRASILLW